MRILGIDPGSITTGLGIVDFDGKNPRYIFHQVLNVSSKLDFPSRIQFFHHEITRVIEEYTPDISALEKIFVSVNPNSALKLGLVRGAIMLSCKLKTLDIIEVSPREMKISLTGYGGADKSQVSSMVKKLLGISHNLNHNESDALALALCSGFLIGSKIFKYKIDGHGPV